MGVDVQQSSLWWVVVGWTSRFDGYVLDYSVSPDQRRRNVVLSDLPVKFADKYPGHSETEAIYQGLCDFSTELLGRSWKRDDGAELALIAS